MPARYNGGMGSLRLLPDRAAAADRLRLDLVEIFRHRLAALVAYGPGLESTARTSRIRPLNTLALVDDVQVADLAACAERAGGWRRAGLATPLLLSRDEFVRSLDAFPFEYGDIIARHAALAGTDPFDGMVVRAEDLRRACEAQAKGHVIHLRGGYVDAGGQPGALVDLIAASAASFESLLGHVARLRGRPAATVDDLARAVSDIDGMSTAVAGAVVRLVADPTLSNDEARRLFPEYLASVERLVAYLDAWRA